MSERKKNDQEEILTEVMQKRTSKILTEEIKEMLQNRNWNIKGQVI